MTPAEPPLIYVDACVYLDLVTRNLDTDPDSGEPRHVIATRLAQAIDDGRVRLAASPLIEAEVLYKVDKSPAQRKVAEKLRAIWNLETTRWADVDRLAAAAAADVGERARPLRLDKSKKFTTADALHLALAVRLRCDFLMTHDGGFPIGQVFDGVNVARPKVVWTETLFDSAAEAS